MTNGSNNDRLDRIEAIVESNSRTIQAMLEQQASDRLKHEERMEYLEGLVGRLVSLEEGQNRMLARLDENQPTVLRKLSAIEDKVDRLLDRTSE